MQASVLRPQTVFYSTAYESLGVLISHLLPERLVSHNSVSSYLASKETAGPFIVVLRRFTTPWKMNGWNPKMEVVQMIFLFNLG